MGTDRFSLTTRHITIFGAVVAAAWSVLILLTPQWSVLSGPLRDMASSPLSPRPNPEGTQVLLPFLVYLLPGNVDGDAWLINTAAMWCAAVLLAAWTIKEGCGLWTAVLICLSCVLSPQMRGQITDFWSTYYLLWFWNILAAYGGRNKQDWLSSAALVGVAATRPTLFPVCIAVWALFRMPGMSRADAKRAGLTVLPAVMVWLVVPWIWWQNSFNPGGVVEYLLGLQKDPSQIGALQLSGRLSLQHLGEFLQQRTVLTSFLLPFLPLAVYDAVCSRDFRWPMLAIPVIFAGMFLSDFAAMVAFLAAPVVFPAAARALAQLSRGSRYIEFPAALVLGILYIAWPQSILLTLVVAIATVICHVLLKPPPELLTET